MDDDGEDGDVGGVDAGDARSLGKGFGAMLLQFLAAFKAQGRDLIIVEPGWNADGLVFLGSGGCNFLLTDVAGIMVSDPELFENRQYLMRRERKAVEMLPGERADSVKGVA